jgi:hypothetical protein
MFARKQKYSEETCPSAALSPTNPTRLNMGSNRRRRGGKQATRLWHGCHSVVKYTMNRFVRVINIPINSKFVKVQEHTLSLSLLCNCYLLQSTALKFLPSLCKHFGNFRTITNYRPMKGMFSEVLLLCKDSINTLYVINMQMLLWLCLSSSKITVNNNMPIGLSAACSSAYLPTGSQDWRNAWRCYRFRIHSLCFFAAAVPSHTDERGQLVQNEEWAIVVQRLVLINS